MMKKWKEGLEKYLNDWEKNREFQRAFFCIAVGDCCCYHISHVSDGREKSDSRYPPAGTYSDVSESYDPAVRTESAHRRVFK